MRIVTQAASSSASLRINAAYHLVEKPPQTVTSCEALNEYDDQDEDRQVEEREAERQRGRVEPGQAPPHGGASNRCASSSR